MKTLLTLAAGWADDVLADAPGLVSYRRAYELTGIPVGTWRRWDRQGRVHTVKVCGGHPRIPKPELRRVLVEGANA